MSVDPDSPEDEVGYGKPPKAHQFKPGQSGNPKGRPKGPGNLYKKIAKHASKKMTVFENGVEKKMAKLDVVISAMYNKAASGDVAAARLLTTLMGMALQFAEDDVQSGYTEADLQAVIDEANWQAQLVALSQEGTDDAS